MAKQITSNGGAISITVVGKIKLPSKKRNFRPFSGGMTIGARLRAKGQSIPA